MQEFLPIGSIVLLKDGTVPLMIMGYCKATSIPSIKLNDYIACIYPYGVMDFEKVLSFKHEHIKEVLFVGRKDDDYNKMVKLLNNK